MQSFWSLEPTTGNVSREEPDAALQRTESAVSTTAACMLCVCDAA